MRTQKINGLKRLGAILAVTGAIVTWTSCSKETAIAPAERAGVEELGGPKAVNNIFGYTNAVAPYSFDVHIGTDASAGTAWGGSGPVHIVSSDASGFKTYGETVQCGAITDATRCNFVYGTTYHIVPTQYHSSPKILRVTFTSLPPHYSNPVAWFVYNKRTNSWSIPPSITWATATQVSSVNWVNC